MFVLIKYVQSILCRITQSGENVVLELNDVIAKYKNILLWRYVIFGFEYNKIYF